MLVAPPGSLGSSTYPPSSRNVKARQISNLSAILSSLARFYGYGCHPDRKIGNRARRAAENIDFSVTLCLRAPTRLSQIAASGFSKPAGDTGAGTAKVIGSEFAPDSPLEAEGFELWVPVRRSNRLTSRQR